MVKSPFLSQARFPAAGMARVLIVNKDHGQYRRVFTRVKVLQDGLCSLCSTAINQDDTIIISHARKSRYYHKGCAERVHLL